MLYASHSACRPAKPKSKAHSKRQQVDEDTGPRYKPGTPAMLGESGQVECTSTEYTSFTPI